MFWTMEWLRYTRIPYLTVSNLRKSDLNSRLAGKGIRKQLSSGTVYDESEYTHCPYCSGELEDDEEVRPCPECGGCLHWDGELWECSNCSYSEED